METKEKNFVSAVVYIHNSSGEIENFLKILIDFFEKNFEHSEIICVNDYSKDNSVEIIKKLSRLTSMVSISIINLSYFHGLELAMNAGVDLAIGDFVLEFDTPHINYDEKLIMDVYKHSLKGYDIVSASPLKRTAISSGLFYYVFKKFTNIKYKMTTETFRIISRRAINRVGQMNKTVFFRKALYLTSGLKTDILKYEVKTNNKKHYQKNEKKYRIKLAIDSLLLFTNIGYKFSMVMTISMIFVSIFTLLYTLFTYLRSDPVSGWTTTLLFLGVSFFGLFGILTIIVKYLQLLLEMVFKRKHYNFESIEKLN